jgi:hypothetical protein
LRGFTEAFHVLERSSRNGGEFGVCLSRTAPKTHRATLSRKANVIRQFKSNLGELS